MMRHIDWLSNFTHRPQLPIHVRQNTRTPSQLLPAPTSSTDDTAKIQPGKVAPFPLSSPIKCIQNSFKPFSSVRPASSGQTRSSVQERVGGALVPRAMRRDRHGSEKGAGLGRLRWRARSLLPVDP